MVKEIETIVKESISKDLVDKCRVEETKFGYSIYLYSNVLLRVITSFKNWNRLEFIGNENLINTFSDDIDVKRKETTIDNKKVLVYQIDIHKDKEIIETVNKLKNTIYEQAEYIFSIHTPSFTYGCCGLYQQCSDEKVCLQASIDREYAKGCSYRGNLENGRIFYGKNKTI